MIISIQRFICSIFDRLDLLVALMGLILSLLLIIIFLFHPKKDLYLLLFTLSSTSCIAYLLVRKRSSLNINITSSHSLTLFLEILLAIFFSFSLLSVNLRSQLYSRPMTYFIIVSIATGIIFLNILICSNRETKVMLFFIIVLGLIICWTQLIIFPSVSGVDPWYHQYFSSMILKSNHIPVGEPYSMIPLMHLLIVYTSLVTNLDIKNSAMMSYSLAFVVCNTLFVFLIGNSISRNNKVGLLATLFLIISSYHIFFSAQFVPNGFGTIFVLIIIYFTLQNSSGVLIMNKRILLLLFYIALILSHTIAAAQIAVMLIVFLISSYLYNISHKICKSNNFWIYQPFLFVTLMISWWIYASGTFVDLGHVIRNAFSIDLLLPAPKEILAYSQWVPLFEQVFNDTGILFYFPLSLIGAFYMISKKTNLCCFIFAIGGLTILSLGFFPYMTGHTLIEERWWFMSEILLAIPLSITFLIMINIFDKRLVIPVEFLFIIILTFTMILSSVAEIDNNAFSPKSMIRFALTDSELKSAKTVSEFGYEDMHTDLYYASRLKFLGFNTTIFDDDIFKGLWKINKQNLILIRKEIIDHPFWLYDTFYSLNYDLGSLLTSIGYSRVYDSQQVVCYVYANYGH